MRPLALPFALAILLPAVHASAQSHDHQAMEGNVLPSESWSVMAHGFVNVVYDRQRGPRGDSKSFASSMFMLMADRQVGPGTLGLRSMVSLDPTIGKGG